MRVERLVDPVARQAHAVTYILPIRRSAGAGAPTQELTAYLQWLAQRCDLLIVDGSAPDEFGAAHECWQGFAEHRAPDTDLSCGNGKVQGVLTGLRHAACDRLIIGDDDVRYDAAALERTIELLEDHDFVMPQNYFDPVPWHARWDTARTLLNRCVGYDLSGTVAVRRDSLARAGGYDGDVLFENLELMRTVIAAGGRAIAPLDLLVQRRPPSTRHFCSQRVRQAYDEIARPRRFIAALALAPLLLSWRHRPGRLVALAAVSVALAERGRRRGGGAAVFPVTASLFAPLWLLERAICSWVALAWWCRGGCPYAGGRLRKAATPLHVLKRRLG